ncbi:Carbonic anhydrase [Tetrabaena socialis]|uniref:Carbonic anhydrase n=1 Tax=Tetrabaena socialis TaxID=47790 RepID=A0A2J8ABP1_9CHLO|nr:Carbonic anhydrase [Tetrabaena socialis]PNH09944.1 Carbonic anhydrase [Tetrabaena socialis]|eukprot:PNG99886.1 Carbonic anhydrase [Tetrabaena socialis]
MEAGCGDPSSFVGGARALLCPFPSSTLTQVLLNLLAGNERVLEGVSTHPHQDLRRVQQVSEQQRPLAAILGCADSRAPAEIIFDQGFGDVFVCRVAGNIATPEELASLEYAVLELGVRVVMVLGHTNCGAVKAALSGKAFPGFIDTLVEHLDVAIARAETGQLRLEAHEAVKNGDEAMLDRVVTENVRYQVQRCKRSVLIREALQERRLLLVGAVYHLDTGRVKVIITEDGSPKE